MITPMTATLDEIRAFVTERMAGSPKPVALHWIECVCRDSNGLRTDEHGYLGEGDYCGKCIRAAVKEQGFGARDHRREKSVHDVEESDRTRVCDSCARALVCVLTPEGVEEELTHWLGENGRHGPPKTPVEWREFSLCLAEPPEDQIPRIREVIARAQIGAAS